MSRQPFRNHNAPSTWLLAFVLFCSLFIFPGYVSYEPQRSFSAQTEWRISEQKSVQTVQRGNAETKSAPALRDFHFRSLLSRVFSLLIHEKVKTAAENRIAFRLTPIFRHFKTIPNCSGEPAASALLG